MAPPAGPDYPGLTVYQNGEFVAWGEARVHVFEPLVKYGVGVFEGARDYWNAEAAQLNLFRLDAHMARLELTQRIMGFAEIVPGEAMAEATLELIRRNGFREAVHVRQMANVSGWGGSGATGPIGTSIVAVPRGSSPLVERGRRAQISSWRRLSDAVMPARAKSTSNYGNARLASVQAARDGYEASIMLTGHGKVSEGEGMCVFLLRDVVVITPSTTSDILESSTRDAVIRLLREDLDIDVVEREVDRSEYHAATEVFFCGTTWKVTPVNSIDGVPIGAGMPGSLTRRLQAAFFDLVHGRTVDRRGWLTPV